MFVKQMIAYLVGQGDTLDLEDRLMTPWHQEPCMPALPGAGGTLLHSNQKPWSPSPGLFIHCPRPSPSSWLFPDHRMGGFGLKSKEQYD